MLEMLFLYLNGTESLKVALSLNGFFLISLHGRVSRPGKTVDSEAAESLF